jgi:hypothetical protein
MGKLTFRQRLENALIRPRQLILLDSHGGKPAKSLNVRIIVVFLVCLGVILATYIAGLNSSVSTGGVRSLIPQHMQLQRQHDQLANELAEAKALIEMKERQLESTRDELSAQQESNNELSQRLRMFESILEARKGSGLQMLNSEAVWDGKSSIRYNLTLVKGGNYPRNISGYITLTAQSPESETIEIMLTKEETRLPFRVETHTFLRGLVDWEHEWYPDKVVVTAFDNRGKELLQTEILVEGTPK